MKWLEIIELRTGNTKNQNLQKAFSQLIQELKQEIDLSKVKIYNNCSLDSDYSVLLFHEKSQPNIAGSVIGIQISALLKDFGLVNHNVMAEVSDHQNKPN